MTYVEVCVGSSCHLKGAPEIVELLCSKLEKEGLSFLSEGYTSCGYAVPRRQEVYACFNRYRRP